MSRQFLGLPAMSLILAVGCGSDSRPALVPVRGQVFLDKTPAGNAVVWLHSVDANDIGKRRPHAIVDKEGNFEIGTYNAKDGAPAGNYRVAISWRTATKPGDEDGESLIPDRYMDPAASTLPRVEVQLEPVIVPPFHLTKN